MPTSKGDDTGSLLMLNSSDMHRVEGLSTVTSNQKMGSRNACSQGNYSHGGLNMYEVVKKIVVVILMMFATYSYSSHDAAYTEAAEREKDLELIGLYLKRNMLQYGIDHKTDNLTILSGGLYSNLPEWTIATAFEGYLPSVEILTYLYSHGHGVSQDYVESLAWWKVRHTLSDGKATPSSSFLEYTFEFSAVDDRKAVLRSRELLRRIHSKTGAETSNSYWYSPKNVNWFGGIFD